MAAAAAMVFPSCGSIVTAGVEYDLGLSMADIMDGDLERYFREAVEASEVFCFFHT